MDLGSASQKTALDRKLQEKQSNATAKPNVIYGTAGDDKIYISRAPGGSGAAGLYEININGQNNT